MCALIYLINDADEGRQMKMQSWEVGQMVRVGFLNFVARYHLAQTKEWILANKEGDKVYLFTAYNGCIQIDVDGAAELIAKDKRLAELREMRAQQRDDELAAKKAAIDKLFAA